MDWDADSLRPAVRVRVRWAFAQSNVPGQVQVQGRLSQTGGPNPVPVNGTVQMTFTLYGSATGGAPIATDGPRTVIVTDGLYDETAAFSTANFTSIDRYIEVSVDSQILTPRMKVSSVPYAFESTSSCAAPVLVNMMMVAGLSHSYLLQTAQRI